MKDSDLLLQFTQGSDQAFAELVRRHLNLVYAAALRHGAGDRHRAEDIAQQVFVDLARKARTLTGHPTIAGWLHASTRYVALNTLRSERRRAEREKQSDVMNTQDHAQEPRWENIQSVIDDVLQELDEEDRQSVLLRFFGQQPFAAIATQLGISENAAQKRVDRALDRLNVALRQRGISSTAVALTVALGEACVAAPATLAGTVTQAALATTASAGAAVSLTIPWVKLATLAATAGVVGWVGVKWSGSASAESKPSSTPAIAAATPARVEPPAQAPVVTETRPAPQLAPVTPPAQVAPVPAPVRKTYAVNPSDTLRRIAIAAGITMEELMAANPGVNPARLRVGDQLYLPAHANVPPPIVKPTAPIPADQIYTVQPGDTLASIAQKKSLLPEELQLLNPAIDWQKLRIGQQIRAP